MSITVIPLQSGSCGNCVYVESAGVRLLFDAGISGRQAEQRLAACGVDIRRVDAVVLTHDHGDHVRCAGVFQRKFGLPLHVTERTLQACARSLGRLERVERFRAGETLDFGSLRVHTYPTPHDAADGVALVVETAGARVGVLTDLGHAFAGLEPLVASLDAVVLESNHDPELLRTGPYPAFLKQRIAGPAGHLSNVDAADLLAGCDGRLQWACLAHLSAQNNRPDLALAACRHRLGPARTLHVASRHAAGRPLRVAG
ncbi:MAG: MBL fold metallo-hydrolase [Candidatus Krumholzibacteriia bacterium]